MPRTWTTEEAADVLPLVGERTVIVHGPDSGRADMSGRDIDCIVQSLDPMWPLRVSTGWRLCQQFNYDLRAWYSILERNGAVLHLDTVDDPRGIGRYGFPTGVLSGWTEDSPPPGVRAAYLLLKRVRKGDRSAVEWARIGELAAADWDRFEQVLLHVLGKRTAGLLSRSCLERVAPDLPTWRRVRLLQGFRRVRTPARVVTVLGLGMCRVAGRLWRPTGLSVLVVGPDGAGKSALADAVSRLGQEFFRRQVHWHWRPQLLPPPASVLGRSERVDAGEPHGRPVHGRLLSMSLLGYYWADWMLGGWLKERLIRIRSGLVVVERGWWDLLVDPVRYRLGGGRRLARSLGALLPKPDLVLVLDAPAAVLLRRKSELSAAELDRQTTAWASSLPRRVRAVRLDASQAIEQVEQDAREKVVDLLEARAIGRIGSGWTHLRMPVLGTLCLPRGPRRASRSSLRVCHPGTRAESITWLAARSLVSLSALRLLPRGAAPPRRLREALAPYLPPRGTVAFTSTDRSLCHAIIVDCDGRCQATAKVATDEIAARVLQGETNAIGQLGKLLPPPLFAPTVVAHEPGLLLLEAVPWRARLPKVRLEEEVARALGAFFAAGAQDGLGPAHGRLIPRKLLRVDRGWVLDDWSEASASRPPFYDPLRYLMRVGIPCGPSIPWVRRTLQAYAEGATIPAGEVSGLVERCIAECPPHPPRASRIS